MKKPLPETLLKPYRDDRHIQRMPFVINPQVNEAVLDDIRLAAVPENGVLWAIAGFRALDVMANAGAETGQHVQHTVLMDNNVSQIKTMHAALGMVGDAASPEVFADQFIPLQLNLTSRIPREGSARQSKEDRNYFAVRGAYYTPRTEEGLAAYFEDQIQNPLSWLYPPNFSLVRRKLDEGTISTAIIDLSDEKRVEVLNGWFKENQWVPAVAYLSSLPGMMVMNGSYYGQSDENVGTRTAQHVLSLLSDETSVLASMPVGREGEKFRLVQVTKDDIQRLQDETRAFGQEPHISYIFSHGRHPILLTGEGNQLALMVDYDKVPPPGFMAAFMNTVDELGFALEDCTTSQVSFSVPRGEMNKKLPQTIEDSVKRNIARVQGASLAG